MTDNIEYKNEQDFPINFKNKIPENRKQAFEERQRKYYEARKKSTPEWADRALDKYEEAGESAGLWAAEKLGLPVEGYRQAQEIRKKIKKDIGYKKGGIVKNSASKRADGCAQRGKTKGKFV